MMRVALSDGTGCPVLQYLVNDRMLARCGAQIRVEVIDRATGRLCDSDLSGIYLEVRAGLGWGLVGRRAGLPVDNEADWGRWQVALWGLACRVIVVPSR